MITKIKDKEGKEIYGREGIIETITEFYNDLYTEFEDWDPGMDGIQNGIIKIFKQEVSLHLTKIFNDIVKKG